MRRFLIWLLGGVPIYRSPSKLSATNQGKDGFAIGVKLVIREVEPGSWAPEVVESETGKPLLFTGHEVTQFTVIRQPEDRWIVAFGLEGVERVIVPIGAK